MLCVALTAAAQRRDTLSSVERAAYADDALSDVTSAAYDASVVASAFRRKVSISSLVLGFDIRSEQEAMLQQEGDALSMGSLKANSFMYLNRKSTVEAHASYRYGVKRNVCWNSSSDYLLLAPYIGADSIGGDLNSEQYMFGGSYVRHDERFTYGVGALYRALHEFRKIDPRPRNITSDLKAQIAGGYNFERYMLGASAAVRIYNQEHGVAYYNIRGANTSQLPMTGFGTYYDRFAGSTDDFLNYEFSGWGYSASLQFVPRGGDGWRVMADYTVLNIKREMPQYNNTPLTELHTQRLSAIVAYGATQHRIRWVVGIEGDYEIRLGNENVLNISAMTNDMILDTFTMYECHTAQASLTAGVEWLHDWGYLFARPKVGATMVDAGYRYPERRMNFLMVEGLLDVGARYMSEKWLADISVGGGYAMSMNSSLFLPASAERRLADMVRKQWSGITADRVTVNVSVSLQRALNRRLSLFLGADYWMYHRDMGAGHIATIEAGIRF